MYWNESTGDGAGAKSRSNLAERSHAPIPEISRFDPEGVGGGFAMDKDPVAGL